MQQILLYYRSVIDVFWRAVLLALIAGVVDARQVTLEWDAVNEATGYNLCFGLESRVYVDCYDVGPATRYTATNLSDKARYFFAANAYNGSGTSAYGNEVVLEPIIAHLGAGNLSVEQVCYAEDVRMALSPNPDYWWKLNESSGTLVANSGDAGIGYNGTLQADTESNLPDWLPTENINAGAYTGALNFDSTLMPTGAAARQAVEVPVVGNMDGLTKVTLMAWVRNNTSAGEKHGRIFSHSVAGTGTSDHILMLGRTGNDPSFAREIRVRLRNINSTTSSTHIATGNQLSTSGTWEHIAVVVDFSEPTNKIKIYLNGAIVYQASLINTQIFQSGTVRTVIGAQPAPTSLYEDHWYGAISNVMLWYGEAATAAEIAAVIDGSFFSSGISPAIIGDTSLSLTPEALLDFQQHRSIIGDTPLSLTPEALLDFQQHRSIIGDVSAALTPAAVMNAQSAGGIVGAAGLVLTPATVLDYQKHASIIGDVQALLTPIATMDFQRHPVITGASAINFSPAAGLDFQQHRSIIGDVNAALTPAAVMNAQSAGGIVGDVGVALTPSSVMDRTQHPGVLGDVALTLIPTGIMDYSQHKSIIGDAVLALTPEALLSFEGAGFVFNGDTSLALTPAALLDYQQHPSVNGLGILVLTPAALMSGPITQGIAAGTIRLIDRTQAFALVNHSETFRLRKLN